MSATGERPRVLVADDEPSIVDVVGTALRHHGLDVAAAMTGDEAVRQAIAWRPHAIILDVMLPDIDGFVVAERLGSEGLDIPILFLSARDGASDRVHGLTNGGEDYVTKPFSLEEVIARVRNILRRRGLDGGPRALRVADLELDEQTREVTRAGRSISLTGTEFRLLRELMLNPRRVLTRSQLLERVWGYDFGGDARVLETYVSYLRKKLDGPGPPLVQTVRGVGYVLRPPRV